MHGGNACLFERALQAQIKIGRVNANEYIRRVVDKMADQLRAYAMQLAVAPQHFNKTHHGEFFRRKQRRATLRDHGRPGDAFNHSIRQTLLDGANQPCA